MPNLCPYSNRLDAVYNYVPSPSWGGAACSVAPSGDGYWTHTTTNASHNWRSILTVLASTQYTWSFYAKRGTMSDIKYSIFDLTHVGNIVAPTSYYASIDGVSYTRVEVSFTTPAGCTLIQVYTCRDSGVTGTFFAGQCQLELGASATAYIETDPILGSILTMGMIGTTGRI